MPVSAIIGGWFRSYVMAMRRITLSTTAFWVCGKLYIFRKVRIRKQDG
jgi:hypothetical protein